MAEKQGFISFEYEKSNQFRAVNAAGATILGATPAGLSIAFFTEHQPLPKAIYHRRLPDGSISAQPDEVDASKDTVVRETEFVMTMSIEAMKGLLKVLEQSIQQIEAQYAAAAAAQVVKQ